MPERLYRQRRHRIPDRISTIISIILATTATNLGSTRATIAIRN
jgi:hypothetical protein